MTKGVLWIDGREYLLAGRYDTKDQATAAADGMAQRWDMVKVRKSPKARAGDWSVWVHGSKRVQKFMDGTFTDKDRDHG